MALVRRASVLENAGQLVVTAVGRVAAARADSAQVGTAQVSAAESTSAGGDAAMTTDPGQPAGGGDANGTSSEAASATSQQAGFGAVLAAFATIGVGGYGAWAVWSSGNAATIIQPADTTAVFGTLLVFAAAVERVLEPFSRWFPGRRTEAILEQSIVALANRTNPTHDDLVAVAQAKAKVERARSNRTVVSWGIATALATVASSAGGFYVLHAVAGPEWKGLPVWVDAIITGIMVGSGTKPVHDIISRVQNAKEQAQNPTA
ncbi:hypothetical protein BDK92_5130 [Micromonospora pisi]|uniref:Uncharacterized protein n=1 Tax=Micromonospora pisi TaxID=589240 RepID=A0A495JRR1_9ACTN|nr:hypothetical protein [Micromonospora pisi]RKR90749.1 hypothetical protein BDK92_5130 [Micromonospora pisi]